MTGVFQFQAYEPFAPVITTLGVADTVCLPSINDGWYYYVDCIVISNLANTARTLDLHLRPVTVVASDANKILNDLSINANTIYQLPIGPLTIPPDYVISGLASVAASVNILLTGTLRILPPSDARMI
jgi:hypothetical protein